MIIVIAMKIKKNKYLMNYNQYSIHCAAFTNSIHRFEIHTGCKFPKIYTSTIRVFFYHYYSYLKCCKSYRDYVEQSKPIRKSGIDTIKFALKNESRLKRFYLYVMIAIPCIGYFINRFK